MADAASTSPSSPPLLAGEKPGRVFLTGAAGRLGTYALRVLGAGGYEVVGVDVRSDPAKPQVRELNLLDAAAVRAAMESGGGFSALVHLGNHSSQGQRPPAQLFNENVSMTMNVFDAARATGLRRIINASSIQVVASEFLPGYTLRPPRIAYLPLDSDSPADPTNTYALSKQVSEGVLAQWSSEMELQAVSLRYPLLLDLESPKLPAWYTQAMAKEPTATCIAQGFSWLSYRDAAELIRSLLTAKWSGARVLLPASPVPRSKENLAQLVERHYAAAPRKPGHEGKLAALVDIASITEMTGWTPHDLLHPPTA